MSKENKSFIYFPSFSSMANAYAKDKFLFDPKDGFDPLYFRFYDDRFPEKYRHKYFLIPAGPHLKDKNLKSKMELGADCTVLGDSGGFQIANGTIKWDEKSSLLKDTFEWLENNSDYAMNLDIPPRIKYEGKFNECLDISLKNFKYFEENQTGKTKFLNVLQGYQTEQYKVWYDKVKGYQFNGWAIGGAANISRLLYAICVLLEGKEFERKDFTLLHVLGQTKMTDFFVYSMLQKNMNIKYPHVQLSTDSSSPIMYSIYGQYLYGPDYRGLALPGVYCGNKGKTKYVLDAEMPCTVPDCPVCSKINFNHIANETPMTRYYLTYHNFFVFLDTIKKVNKLVHSHYEAMDGLIDRTLYKVLGTIDDIFNSETPMKVYEKNRKLYEEFSSKSKEFVNEDKLNEFFSFEEKKSENDIDIDKEIDNFGQEL